jgi:formamidase
LGFKRYASTLYLILVQPSHRTQLEITGVYASSRHIPGVRFAGVSHPGLIGTAPSPELLATWNERECGLIAAHATSVPPVAFPPEPMGAHVGQDLSKEVREKIVKEGARTIPGREHGGNCDVRTFFFVEVSAFFKNVYGV